jgi:glycosyltransferase involved in cell wall biosynthesis
MVDKYYFIKGGAERYFFELAAVLEKNGHEVIPFSMKHPSNVPTVHAADFMENIDFNPASAAGKAAVGIRSLGRLFYSLEARDKVRRIVRRTRPDIAHLHMIDHQISPSILTVFREEGIPVVQTVHTFKAVCPSYRLYHMGRGRICEKCLHGAYWHAPLDRCHKNSFPASLLVAAETAFHKAIRIHERGIDRFLVPSRFMGAKLAEGGLDPMKIRHLFYTIQVDRYPFAPGSEPYFLYYGRLSEEKGLSTLLDAVAEGTPVPLHVVGDGPQRAALEATAAGRGIRNVRFVGPLEGEALKKAVSAAMFVVVPSEWYENSPLVVYESFAMGKPVIGAAIGGIPELISEGRDGLLFRPGDARDLRRSILEFTKAGRPALAAMGRRARRKAEALFSPEAHYSELTGIYDELLESRRPSRRPAAS